MYRKRHEYLRDMLIAKPNGLSRDEIYARIPEYKERKAGERTFFLDLQRIRDQGYEVPRHSGRGQYGRIFRYTVEIK